MIAPPIAITAAPATAHGIDGHSRGLHSPTQAMGAIVSKPVPCRNHRPPRAKRIPPTRIMIHFMSMLPVAAREDCKLLVRSRTVWFLPRGCRILLPADKPALAYSSCGSILRPRDQRPTLPSHQPIAFDAPNSRRRSTSPLQRMGMASRSCSSDQSHQRSSKRYVIRSSSKRCLMTLAGLPPTMV